MKFQEHFREFLEVARGFRDVIVSGGIQGCFRAFRDVPGSLRGIPGDSVVLKVVQADSRLQGCSRGGFKGVSGGFKG